MEGTTLAPWGDRRLRGRALNRLLPLPAQQPHLLLVADDDNEVAQLESIVSLRARPGGAVRLAYAEDGYARASLDDLPDWAPSERRSFRDL